MRDGEGLVQVHVRDIGPQMAGGGQADLGVEVGSVHVHLAAVGVDDGADFHDGFLEHAVRRGVGDHQAGEPGRVLFGLGLEVGDIDVAVFVAGDGDDVETAHLRRGRVGAVCRFGNQADVALPFTPAFKVTADGDDTGVFALRAGIGLHADGVHAGDGFQPVFELADHFQMTGGLIDRREGVQVGQFRPGDRHHLAHCVELHGAGAERDHRMVERQIAVLQALEVAQHVVLAVMAMEHRVRQDRVAALQGGRQGLVQFAHLCFERFGADADASDQADERDDILTRGFFVERETDDAVFRLPQVVTGVQCSLVNGDGACTEIELQGVEKAIVLQGDAAAPQAFGEQQGQAVNALGNPAQALRAVIDRVEPGHVGEQHLRGAQVGVGFLAADMLFAGLQGHAVGGFAACITRDTDDASGHGAHMGKAGGEEGGMRAAEAQRNAEALR